MTRALLLCAEGSKVSSSGTGMPEAMARSAPKVAACDLGSMVRGPYLPH